jgi:hypothetical protein
MKLVKARDKWLLTEDILSGKSLFLTRNSNVKRRWEHSFRYTIYFACSKGLNLPLNPILCNKCRGITASSLVSCLLPYVTAAKCAGLVVLCTAPEISWLSILQQVTYGFLMSMKKKVKLIFV